MSVGLRLWSHFRGCSRGRCPEHHMFLPCLRSSDRCHPEGHGYEGTLMRHPDAHPHEHTLSIVTHRQGEATH